MENLRVIYRRDDLGALESLEIWRGPPAHDGGEMVFDTLTSVDPHAALQEILWMARDYYRADPYSDHLPPDNAVIAAYEEHVA